MTASRTYWVWSMIILFFGGLLLGVDQAMLGVLMPDIQKTFHFGVFGAGLLSSMTLIAIGFFSVVIGGYLADRAATRKNVMVPGLAGFSIFSWLTGVASGFGAMILIRLFLGAFQGIWEAPSFAKATEDPPVRFRALSSGIINAGLPVGLGFVAPLLAPHIAAAWGWRAAFSVMAIPGLILAAIAWKVLRPGIEKNVENPLEHAPAAQADRLFSVLRFRNVLLSALVGAFLYGTITVFIVFAPIYLTKTGFSLVQAGNALSGWGVGGLVGAIILPLISDRLGRKWTGGISLFLGGLGVYFFTNAHTGGTLFLAAVIVGVFIQGAIPLYLILIAGETVPDRMRAKATAVVNFGITTVGGGLFALLLGAIGQAFGLKDAILIGVVFSWLGVVATLFIQETAPRFRRASA